MSIANAPRGLTGTVLKAARMPILPAPRERGEMAQAAAAYNDAGWTFGEIARAWHVTRDSVLGMVYRLRQRETYDGPKSSPKPEKTGRVKPTPKPPRPPRAVMSAKAPSARPAKPEAPMRLRGAITAPHAGLSSYLDFSVPATARGPKRVHARRQHDYPEPVAPALRPSILTVGAQQCRFILASAFERDAPAGEQQRLCGAPTPKEVSWCRDHAGLVFMRYDR
jgi:hypothetical protein